MRRRWGVWLLVGIKYLSPLVGGSPVSLPSFSSRPINWCLRSLTWTPPFYPGNVDRLIYTCLEVPFLILLRFRTCVRFPLHSIVFLCSCGAAWCDYGPQLFIRLSASLISTPLPNTCLPLTRSCLSHDFVFTPVSYGCISRGCHSHVVCLFWPLLSALHWFLYASPLLYVWGLRFTPEFTLVHPSPFRSFVLFRCDFCRLHVVRLYWFLVLCLPLASSAGLRTLIFSLILPTIRPQIVIPTHRNFGQWCCGVFRRCDSHSSQLGTNFASTPRFATTIARRGLPFIRHQLSNSCYRHVGWNVLR